MRHSIARSGAALLAAAALVLPTASAVAEPAADRTTGPAASTDARAGAPVKPPVLPRHIDGGAWPTSHVQGAAIDEHEGVVYWSFTQVLVKTDLEGNVLGTVTGLTGHLGDLDLNTHDGRVYGSLEYKAEEAFYIAIFDGAKIDRIGMDAETDGIMTTVYLPEVVEDFTADMDRDGVFDGDTGNTADHRYGSSGIDGVAFGPAAGKDRGRAKGKQVLRVAYGVYAHKDRIDNDNQVLLEYDVASWRRYEKPLVQDAPHRSGPREVRNKYFVFTGNTTYGVQNLEYDEASGHWFLAVYKGTKPGYPNYSLFVVDGDRPPYEAVVRGQAEPELGDHLSLLPAGQYDPASSTFGWTFDASYGLVSVGGGYFYGASGGPVVEDGIKKQTGALDLYRWTGATPTPFEKVG
ncbi:hypothetical protein [Mumia sp. ZJ430]|uniref:hypothetical protein n=1 Tax=Mumia sp. ZJ430 TaxID=2708083 RepID=UPI001421A80D|nr:hypothetical protein [Mumia sp. ZJ430]